MVSCKLLDAWFSWLIQNYVSLYLLRPRASISTQLESSTIPAKDPLSTTKCQPSVKQVHFTQEPAKIQSSIYISLKRCFVHLFIMIRACQFLSIPLHRSPRSSSVFEIKAVFYDSFVQPKYPSLIAVNCIACFSRPMRSTAVSLVPVPSLSHPTSSQL